MSKSIIINLSDANCTETYLDILKKYNINIRSTFKNAEDRKTAFTKELKALDDEEARNELRITNKSMFEIINSLLGEIENRKKLRGNKLNTPKSIMTLAQQRKNECLKHNGIQGEIEAFLYNILDVRMDHFHNAPLLPKTEFRDNINSSTRLRIAKHLVNSVLIEKQQPSKINIKKIAEEILKKEKSLADKKLVIKIIKDFFE